jgi:hypothetical protein
VKSSKRGQRGKTDGSYASNNPRLSAFMVLTLGSGEKDDVPGCGPRATGRPLPAAVLAVSPWFDTELKNPTVDCNAETANCARFTSRMATAITGSERSRCCNGFPASRCERQKGPRSKHSVLVTTACMLGPLTYAARPNRLGTIVILQPRTNFPAPSLTGPTRRM